MRLVIELLNLLIPYGHFAYAIMMGLLLACGFGFPMPEDIILVSGGILSSHGVTNLWLTNVICLLGVLIGDGTIFMLGKRIGPRIKETRLFSRIITEERESKVKVWFSKYGDKVIFFARFAPGLRMPLFLTSGIYQVKTWKFFALDGFAAIISVPLWIWVGYFFGSNLELLEHKIKRLQMGIYSLLGVVLLVIFAIWYIKRRWKIFSE